MNDVGHASREQESRRVDTLLTDFGDNLSHEVVIPHGVFGEMEFELCLGGERFAQGFILRIGPALGVGNVTRTAVA